MKRSILRSRVRKSSYPRAGIWRGGLVFHTRGDLTNIYMVGYLVQAGSSSVHGRRERHVTQILIIEGDACKGAAAKLALAHAGHSVVHDTDLSAVRKYEGTFELLVVGFDDLRGEQRGATAFRALREEIGKSLRPDAPILVVFDYETTEDERLAVMRAGEDFIHRPCSAAEFAGKVESLARRRGYYGHISGVLGAAKKVHSARAN